MADAQQVRDPEADKPQVRGRDPREGAGSDEARTGPQIIEAAAAGRQLDGAEQNVALEWFLSDDPDDQDDLTRTIEINVGKSDGEKWIPWTIRAVDLDTLRRIRKATITRRGGDLDEVQANLKIVVSGTVAPDLTEAAHAMHITTAEKALQRRFRHKPGLLGQISGEIMALSGYDDEDVREVSAAKA